MHPKIVQKRTLEAAKATAEGLAKVEETLERLERKVDALMKAVKDGRSYKSNR